jgi:protein SCO1
MKRWLLTLAAAVALTGAARAQYGQAKPGQQLPNPADVGIDQRLGEPVPLELTFRDEIGRDITLGACVDGKPTILVLAYFRCPQLCTQVLNGLLDALRTIPYNIYDHYNVITVSFDPRERPPLAAAKQAAYTLEYGRKDAAKGWRFLTGDAPQIEALAKAVGFRYRWDEGHQQYDHAAGIMVLTPGGRLSRYFYGIEYAKWVGDGDKKVYDARDLRLGLVEASEGKIGSPVDRILLLCMHYDPGTGKYTGTVLAILRAAGVLTVLALAVPIVWACWRERRRARAAAG